MKFLILQLGSLPHTLATLPLVKALHAAHPQATIHMVCVSSQESYWQQVSELEKVFANTGDATPLVLNLLKEKYHHCIDLSCNRRTSFIKGNLAAQYNAILTRSSLFSFWQKIVGAAKKPISSKQYIACVKNENLSTNNLLWHYPLQETDLLKKEDLPLSHSAGFYCVELGGVLSVEKCLQVINSINHPVVIIGKENYKEKAIQLAQTDSFKIYNAIGKFIEAEQVQILQRSKVNIVESPIYCSLAAAAQKSIFCIAPETMKIDELEPYCLKTVIIYKKIDAIKQGELQTALAQFLGIQG
jgi:hypothetical protein